MAEFQSVYFSEALKRKAYFRIFIPNDRVPEEGNQYYKRRTKAVFLLHGYTGIAETIGLEELAYKYNMALIMPNGENSFYVDGAATGSKYATMIAVELMDYIRKTFDLAQSPEETYITGLSMGGFGALYLALAYPDRFGKTAALSSALIIHKIAEMKPGEDNGVANYEYYAQCFGDLSKVEDSDKNPECLVRKIKASGGVLPQIYMCCGTEDFLLEANREMHRFLEEQHAEHEYHEGPGKHDMVFWNEYFKKAFAWMAE